MKTRDKILLVIADGQREKRPKSVREIAKDLGKPTSTMVKEYFSQNNTLTGRFDNGDLVEWSPYKARTLRLKSAVIVRENGAVKVGRWEPVDGLKCRSEDASE